LRCVDRKAHDIEFSELQACMDHLDQQEWLVTKIRRGGRNLCRLLLAVALLGAPCRGEAGGRDPGPYSNSPDEDAFMANLKKTVLILGGAAVLALLATVLEHGPAADSKTGPISFDPHHLDFGNVSVGNSVTCEIQLVNRGAKPLHVSPPSISGKCFSTANPWVGELVLAGGGQGAISVVFNPGASAKYSGLLEVTVVDPAKTGTRTITIPLAGQAVMRKPTR
jgi:hypothetical protein